MMKSNILNNTKKSGFGMYYIRLQSYTLTVVIDFLLYGYGFYWYDVGYG